MTTPNLERLRDAIMTDPNFIGGWQEGPDDACCGQAPGYVVSHGASNEHLPGVSSLEETKYIFSCSDYFDPSGTEREGHIKSSRLLTLVICEPGQATGWHNFDRVTLEPVDHEWHADVSNPQIAEQAARVVLDANGIRPVEE